MKRTLLTLTVFASLIGVATAGPTVQFTGVYGQIADIQGLWYTGQIPAGIHKILIDGVPTDSFCIDLDDNATTNAVEYSIVGLAAAPDPAAGPMLAQKAEAIRKLWDMAYTPNMTRSQAAALQLAIWDCGVDLDYNIGAGDFWVNGNNYGAQALLDNVQNHTGQANLMGLSHDEFQDFTTTVPVPGALLLGSLGTMCIGWFRSRKSV